MDTDMTILVREEYLNADDGIRFGDSGEPQEAWTDDVGRLFKDMSREYGRCTSKVYIDTKDGSTIERGWVFTKRMEYDGYRGYGERYYTREVWVTLFEPCEADDPQACTSTRRNGAVTHHPFKCLDLVAYRKAARKAKHTAEA